MNWNNMNVFLLTEFCINREVLRLLVNQAARFYDHHGFIQVCPWSTPCILHPLLGPIHYQGWLLAIVSQIYCMHQLGCSVGRLRFLSMIKLAVFL